MVTWNQVEVCLTLRNDFIPRYSFKFQIIIYRFLDLTFQSIIDSKMNKNLRLCIYDFDIVFKAF